MILVDSNIPMYLVGAPHANKARARHLLELAVARRDRLVTDAEALQEILHRYVAIDRLDAIQPAFDALLGVVDEVLPAELPVVERAKHIVLGALGLTARDVLHEAITEIHGATQIMSFDNNFDLYPGIDACPELSRRT